jgi:hypothetical protein
VTQDLIKDNNGKLLMQSSDSEFAKPFRLWSNTAITEIEMTSQSPEAAGS